MILANAFISCCIVSPSDAAFLASERGLIVKLICFWARDAFLIAKKRSFWRAEGALMGAEIVYLMGWAVSTLLGLEVEVFG